MAVRLSVLLIQSSPPTAAARRMTEEVVGQLIGAGGIDLTLIGPLASLAETSTDRLTLETLAGDVAALDWQEPKAIIQGLAALNFHAQRAPHPHDRDTPAAVARTRQVFAFDMSRFRGAKELVEALRQLNERRQIRTFSIGAVNPAGIGTTGKNPTFDSDRPTSGKPTDPVEETNKTHQDEADVKNSDGRPRGLDLDDLLDQLDQADP